MTYLQMINAILRRLREPEVTTFDESDYSQMVGDYINDAMDIVQNAWNWSMLHEELSLVTVASTTTLTLTGIGEAGQVYQILNDTTNHKIVQRPDGWIKQQAAFTSTAEGDPSNWGFSSQATNGDLTVTLYPTPDAVYTIKALVKKHQAAMTAGADVILVPDQPVLQQSLAFCLEERGDTGGSNNMSQQARADRVLADYVGLDQQRHPELLIWEEV